MWLGIALAVMLAGPALAQDVSLRQFSKLSAERDWPWWRGPSRNGIAAENNVPTDLTDNEGYAWKTPVTGRGHSSPVVVGDRVLLTTADQKQQIHSVLAFDRATGKPLWDTEVSRGGFPARNHPKNTEATPTIACDGERLFAAFFHHEAIHLTALSLEGKRLWEEQVAPFNPKRYEYGYAPSPVIYGDGVIVASEYDGKSAITALDRTTGKQLWQTPRPSNISFSSPVVAHVAGKDQLLISGADEVTSYDPKTGKQLWSTPGTTAATCGTIVWDGDVVYASGGYPGSETIAIQADGSGKVLWRNKQKCYEQSMLAHDGYLYALTDSGVLFCWRGNDGQEMWKKRLAGPISASPVLAGGHVYWANELGTLYVFKPNPQQLEIVAENQVGTDSFPSPAICGGQIFLRVGQTTAGKRQEFLYCFGKQR
jgi:outer membrane protein assembly factor BamB